MSELKAPPITSRYSSDLEIFGNVVSSTSAAIPALNAASQSDGNFSATLGESRTDNLAASPLMTAIFSLVSGHVSH